MVIGGQTLAPRVPRPASAIAILLLGLASAIRSGVGAEISPDDLAFFEREIRPLLVANCHQCHSEEGGKRKGGLWLDRRAGWEAGGDSGAAVRPGDPAKSLLIEAVRYTNPDREMPPDGKLSAEKIAKLEEWVRRGAPDPRDEPTAPRDNEKDAENRETLELERGRRFWSFQPVQEPPVPAPKDAAWPRTDIDRFIRARQEAENLAPMPDADRETLLRRLTIVLTGLPPTLAEREAFLAADEPGAAFESAVDRLLASDAFAERWGRHWLDIVRYSDTSGGGRALTFTDAWRFRDYVIDSFRKDKPLDRLVREHIAGDLLPFESPAQQLEQLSGTGFLVLGPHNYENQDKELLELEIVDEQLDTLGQAFLGLTLGCARCHDHKFDPIPATDYYAMAGILTSTHSVNHANVSQWMTRAVAVSDEERGAHEAWLARDAALETEIAAVRESLGEFGGDLPKSASIEGLEGLVLDNTDAERTGDWSDSTSNPRFVGDGYLHCDGEGGDTSYAVFRLRVPADGRYEVRVSYSAGTNRVRDASVTVWHAKGDDTLRIDQRKPPRHARLFEDVGVFEFETDKEVMVRVGNQGVKSRGVVVADAVQLVPEAEAVRAAAAAPDRDRIAALEDRLKKLQAEQRALEKSRPNLPSVMCVEDGESPADTAVRVGGLPRNLGKTPPRGFLRVTAPEGAPRPPIGSGSGRLELAAWLTSPENPLTARVLANRIWMHLFGEGIVRTPDNFGRTGAPPADPALLDFLATRLVENGWSAKKTLREILLSRVWGLSSGDDPAAAALDPDNRFLWRAHRRKVDAETFRDSVLAIAGTLDRDAGGPSLPKDFKSEFGYQFATRKRSVYVPVFRNRMHEALAAFDFANPNFVVGKRAASNIPTQALFLMNDEFIHAQAEAAARRVLAAAPDGTDEDRVRAAWRMTLCRDPRPDEIALALPYLSEEGAASSESLPAWTALMRTLFACVDFQYYR